MKPFSVSGTRGITSYKNVYSLLTSVCVSIAEFKSIGLHTMWLTTKAYIFNVIFVFLYFFFF